HRRAVGRCVEEQDDWVNQRLEVSPLLRERGGPGDPIELGVFLSVVERQAVLVLNLLVIIEFLAQRCGREKVQAQDAVPNQIVFLAPRAGTIEGETEMVAVIR